MANRQHIYSTNRIALGTVQFGLPYGIANKAGQTPASVAKLMLQLARTNGIDTLDTAIAYGESESCLGNIGIEGFRLVTKLPPLPNGVLKAEAWARAQVEASLARLQVNGVSGLLLHRPEDLLGGGGARSLPSLARVESVWAGGKDWDFYLRSG